MTKYETYLAGQPDEYEGDWKQKFKDVKSCNFYDWEIDSDQSSPNAFFTEDLQAINQSDFLIANPGTAPSEATWIEIGYFYANNVNEPGATCENLIIIWTEARQPEWSLPFIKKTGHVVPNVKEAKKKLQELIKNEAS